MVRTKEDVEGDRPEWGTASRGLGVGELEKEEKIQRVSRFCSIYFESRYLMSLLAIGSKGMTTVQQ